MEVILKQEVENLGGKDELVTVKNGYGLNYLIPQGFAVMATAGNKKMLAETIKQRAHKEAKLIASAKELATKLEALTVKIGAKAGDNGKIFGSVNNIQIADAIKKQGLEIDRKAIIINEEAVKTLGKYNAKVKLHKEVVVEIEFEVVED